MKRVSFLLLATLLAAPLVVRGQDAAVEERLNKLAGQIEDLIAAKNVQNKRIEDLARDVAAVQQRLDKPNAAYATQDEVKQLKSALQEVDQKRQQDNERILKELQKELQKLGETLAAQPKKAPVATLPAEGSTEQGAWYVVESGDTLSVIAKAYTDKGFKVTADQILKANQGLDEKRLRIGQKIWIPAPRQ